MNKRTIIIILLVMSIGVLAFLYFDNNQEPVKNNQSVKAMTEREARVIAEAACIKGGEALSAGTYNENSRTWWFDANLNATQPGCNPACVVSAETKTAEINWRCTGLVEPENPVPTTTPGDSASSSTVTNFTECAAAGNPIMESYPRQCSANGQTFTEVIEGNDNASTTIKAITDLFIAKYPKYAATLFIKINAQTDAHARGSVSFVEGEPGGIFLAVKVEGQWQIVFDGNGAIPCSLSSYNFPASMLSDCAE